MRLPRAISLVHILMSCVRNLPTGTRMRRGRKITLESTTSWCRSSRMTSTTTSTASQVRRTYLLGIPNNRTRELTHVWYAFVCLGYSEETFDEDAVEVLPPAAPAKSDEVDAKEVIREVA